MERSIQTVVTSNDSHFFHLENTKHDLPEFFHSFIFFFCTFSLLFTHSFIHSLTLSFSLPLFLFIFLFLFLYVSISLYVSHFRIRFFISSRAFNANRIIISQHVNGVTFLFRSFSIFFYFFLSSSFLSFFYTQKSNKKYTKILNYREIFFSSHSSNN